MDLSRYGSHKPFRWTHNYLVEILSSGKDPVLTDPLHINAFRAVDRSHFAPDAGDEVYMDKDLQLHYGETLTRPTILAQALKHLQPRSGGKYLDIGSGSGYMAMLIGHIAGAEGKVYSLERVQWLWEQCRTKQRNYPEINSVKYLYRDGLLGLPDQAPYDGIYLSFHHPYTAQQFDKLKSQLKLRTGVLIYPEAEQIKALRRLDFDDYEVEFVTSYLPTTGKSGLS